MKEEKFRIIELPTHQMLLTKDFDSESNDARLLLVITVFLDEAKAYLKLAYNDEEKRNNMFLMSEEKAQGFLDIIISKI